MVTNTSERSGKGHGHSNQFEGFPVLALGDEIQKVLSIDPGRACDLAGRVDTLACDFNLRCDLESKVPGFNIDGVMKCGWERGTTDIFGVGIQVNMVHTGIAHDGHVHDILSFNTHCGCDLFRNAVEPVNDGPVQDLKTVWVGHGKADAGHHIFTIYHLRIHHGAGRKNFAVGQITKVAGNRGSPHIHRKTVYFFDTPRFHFDDLFVMPNGYGYLPISPHARCFGVP